MLSNLLAPMCATLFIRTCLWLSQCPHCTQGTKVKKEIWRFWAWASTQKLPKSLKSANPIVGFLLYKVAPNFQAILLFKWSPKRLQKIVKMIAHWKNKTNGSDLLLGKEMNEISMCKQYVLYPAMFSIFPAQSFFCWAYYIFILCTANRGIWIPQDCCWLLNRFSTWWEMALFKLFVSALHWTLADLTARPIWWSQERRIANPDVQKPCKYSS